MTDGIESLKNALAEFNEEGIVSAKTLVELNDTFGDLGGSWTNFVEIMTSGTYILKDAEEATRRLMEDFVNKKLSDGPIEDLEQYLALIEMLERFGVKNAKSYVGGLQSQAYAQKVADNMIADDKEKDRLQKIIDDDTGKYSIRQVKDAEKNFAELNAKTQEDYIKEIEGLYGVNLSAAEEQLLIDKAITAERLEQAAIQAKIQEAARQDAEYAKEAADEQLRTAKENLEKVEQEGGGGQKPVGEVGTYDEYTGQYYYNGQYYPFSDTLVDTGLDDAQKAVEEAEKAVAEADAKLEITPEVNTDNAEQEAQKARQEYQDALEDRGLTLDVELEVTLGQAGTVFDTYTTKMETLASIQSEVAKGFTISAEKAREFAQVYPEILANAKTTSNGQIALNADVVNAFLSGKREELNAAIDAEIAEIDAEIASLEAENTLANEQLRLAKEVAEGKLGIDAEANIAMINNSNALVSTMEANGVDSTTANKIAYAAMAGNTDEYGTLVKDVAAANGKNLDASAKSSADSIYTNMSNAKASVVDLMKQVWELADAIKAAPGGHRDGDELGGSGKGGESLYDDSIYVYDVDEFKGTDPEEIPYQIIDLDDYISQLQTTIDTNETTIDTLEGTKALLESQKNRPMSSFDPEKDSSLNGSEDADGDGKSNSDEFKEAMEYWDNRIAANQARYDQLQSEIDLLESQGKMAGEEYYQEQIDLENERLALLEAKKAEALAYLGLFEEGSSEWWEVASEINSIEGEIDDVTASIQDLNDAMDQVKWDVFDESHTRFGNLTTQLETVRTLIAPNNEEDWFNDEGEWTEKGVGVLGTYVQQIELDKNSLKDVQEQLANLNPNDFDSEQEYYNKKQELLELEQDYATSISDNEQAVVGMYESQIDAIEEYTNKLVESYNEYIDVVKEALDAERDLYDFKRNIEKQTKDIGELERRIASLSGSDNAADIAERRKLQAELVDKKSDLDDTYYDHAKDAQLQALDDESAAYEEAMTNYVEELRTTIDTMKSDMTTFMEYVTSSVMLNAGIVKDEYIKTGITLDEAIVSPWDKAIAAMGKYETDGLSKMNAWTTEEGFFGKFKTKATNQLKSPWTAGTNAAKAFKTDVSTQMDKVVEKIRSNVATAKNELSKLYQQIKDTEKRAAEANVTVNSGGSSGNNSSGNSNNPSYSGRDDETHDPSMHPYNALRGGASYYTTHEGSSTGNKVKTIDGKQYLYVETMKSYFLLSDGTKIKDAGVRGRNFGYYFPKDTTYYKYYAKGTTGAKKDHWAITDEPQYGDELVLIPGKDGNLQYMRKGTGVVPADLTENLMEWGKLNPNMSTFGVNQGVNLMSNYVSKPEFNLTFDALVKAEKITEDTLPEVKRFVQKEINNLVKQMNYALKGVGSK